MKHQRGLTLIDTLVALVLLALVVGVLPPLMRGVRSPAGMYVSLNNVRQIVRAMHQYRADTGGQMPMRGCAYSQGQIGGGWDTWHFGGKNCDSSATNRKVIWAGSQFDESAYSRPLNLYFANAPIPVPAGYVNMGQGPTWRFSHGIPSTAERLALDLRVFQSPGDVASYQGNKTNLGLGFADPDGVTSYDSTGTSYHVNMAWWDRLPQHNFTEEFDAGVQAFRSALDGAPIRFTRPPGKPFVTPNLSKIVWVQDQHAGLIVNRLAFGNSQLPDPLPGEFGGDNRSVSGFLDGHVAYVEFQNNTPNTGTYHLFPWLP